VSKSVFFREQTNIVMSPISVKLLPAFAAFALCTYAAQPRFDIATVKRSPPPPGDAININIGGIRNGKVTFENASLSDCLKFAYQLVSDDQLIAPDWAKSKDVRFDIVAEFTPGESRDLLSLKVQSLLAERLKVQVHHEQRVLRHLLLTAAKKGVKLSPATDRGNNNGAAGHIDASTMSMQVLATLLSRFEHQTVIDGTGLTSQYKFKLDWAPEDDPAGPSLFTAVQEQLGLKLESRKDPVDVLVVDHAEQTPTDN
jgi:uncharacterized protein (TIGR03435 family)